MPADFECELTDQLSLLRSDVDRVAWAEDTTVRHRGAARQVRRAASTGLAVVAGVGVLGYSAVVGVPGDPVMLANPYLAPSPSDRTSSPQPTAHESRSAPGRILSPGPTTPFATDSTSPDSAPPAPGAVGSGPHNAAPPGPTNAAPPPPTTPSPTPPGDDTPTASPTPPELGLGALLTGSEMPTVNDSELTWSGDQGAPGEGTATASVCQSADLAGLGGQAAVHRTFTWGTDATVTGVNVVSVFGSAADASAAYDTFAGWLGDCAWGTSHGPTEVTVPAGAASWWWVGHDNGDETGEVEVVGLARNGAALSVVVWHQQGQDLTYDSDPMAPPLQASADRLTAYAGD